MVLSETFVTVMGDFGSLLAFHRSRIFRVKCAGARARFETNQKDEALQTAWVSLVKLESFASLAIA